ncbi:hypothetical protein BZG36_04429 [Bifiguratus adelaidae]|uniref:Adenylate kinase active site lid domain-containing protein n=1 Tax=Bifiguratus adelaidae TaxID=1938954 RepID=A0A261XX29_9FUNG|nr:hypothetical protein BZG36_04429 [Bifiguratus adelaidae]
MYNIGTNCEAISRQHNLLHISVGDLLRNESSREGPLADEINSLMKEGKMIPMSVTKQLLTKAISDDTTHQGYLIDGFPRNMDQALQFERSLGKCACCLVYECPEDELVQRLLNRGKSSGRADDNIDTIKKRIRVYEQETLPVIEYFQKQGRARVINSNAPKETVARNSEEVVSGLSEEAYNILADLGIAYLSVGLVLLLVGLAIFIVMFKWYRESSDRVGYRLLCCATVTQIVSQSASIVFLARKGYGKCAAPIILYMWGTLSTVYFMTAISINLFTVVVLQRQRSRLLEASYIIVSILVPIAYSVLCLTHNRGEPVISQLCWRGKSLIDKASYVDDWLVYYLWVIISVPISAFCIGGVLLQLRRDKARIAQYLEVRASRIRAINEASKDVRRPSSNAIDITQCAYDCHAILQGIVRRSLSFPAYNLIISLALVIAGSIDNFARIGTRWPAYVLYWTLSGSQAYFIAILFFRDPKTQTVIRKAHQDLRRTYVDEFEWREEKNNRGKTKLQPWRVRRRCSRSDDEGTYVVTDPAPDLWLNMQNRPQAVYDQSRHHEVISQEPYPLPRLAMMLHWILGIRYHPPAAYGDVKKGSNVPYQEADGTLSNDATILSNTYQIVAKTNTGGQEVTEQAVLIAESNSKALGRLHEHLHGMVIPKMFQLPCELETSSPMSDDEEDPLAKLCGRSKERERPSSEVVQGPKTQDRPQRSSSESDGQKLRRHQSLKRHAHWPLDAKQLPNEKPPPGLPLPPLPPQAWTIQFIDDPVTGEHDVPNNSNASSQDSSCSIASSGTHSTGLHGVHRRGTFGDNSASVQSDQSLLLPERASVRDSLQKSGREGSYDRAVYKLSQPFLPSPQLPTIHVHNSFNPQFLSVHVEESVSGRTSRRLSDVGSDRSLPRFPQHILAQMPSEDQELEKARWPRSIEF